MKFWSPGSQIIKVFSSSPHVSMKFFLLINVWHFNIYEQEIWHKYGILGLSEPGKKLHFLIFLYL